MPPKLFALRVKRSLQKVVSKTGYAVVRRNKLARADDAAVYSAPYNGEIRTIYDIGANIGQSLFAYRRLFPSAKILSFEPMTSSYTTLSKCAAKIPNCETYNYAVGDSNRDATIYGSKDSVLATLCRNRIASSEGAQEEQVQVKTLDTITSELGTDFIDILKIDVEGFELEVFQGAKNTLNGQVGMIFVEVGLRDSDVTHTHFSKVYNCLTDYGFHSLGLYDLVHSVHSPFANALFIHKSKIKRALYLGKED